MLVRRVLLAGGEGGEGEEVIRGVVVAVVAIAVGVVGVVRGLGMILVIVAEGKGCEGGGKSWWEIGGGQSELVIGLDE